MDRTAEDRPDDGRKTVLIVEDDLGTQRVLASGLATSLGMFDVLTANHGQEAVELLESRPVDVVVTDLAMPVMDGFALIGYLTNRGTTLPVVVLSALAPTTVADGLDGYGGLTVLRKPAGYPEVARAVLDALERHDLGQVAGIPLASVLQLVEAERRTCSLGVTSGRRRGRLHFESGRLINAFSDDFGAEGEAAAYDILTWSRTAIEFERLPEGVRRTIDVPTQTLLIEVAHRQDEQREREAKLTPATPMPRTEHAAVDAPEPGGDVPEPAVDALDAPAERSDVATNDEATADAIEEAPFADPAPEPEPDATPAAEWAAPAEPTPDPAARPEPLEPSTQPGGRSEVSSPEAPAASPDAPSAPAPDEPSPAPTDPAPTDPAPYAAPPPPKRPEPHADLVAAIERLTQRVQAADTALAAVAEEVDAFQAAQLRYDEEIRRQEERRSAVEAARRDVADLARQILARMDGLFDVFGDGASEQPLDADPPAGGPSNA